jgi:hypothetical protein
MEWSGASPGYYKRMVKTPYYVRVKGKATRAATEALKDEIIMLGSRNSGRKET